LHCRRKVQPRFATQRTSFAQSRGSDADVVIGGKRTLDQFVQLLVVEPFPELALDVGRRELRRIDADEIVRRRDFRSTVVGTDGARRQQQRRNHRQYLITHDLHLLHSR
jgi:hypothetical protein